MENRRSAWTSAATAAETIKIGHTTALSGNLAAYGDIAAGWQAYIDYVNETGGIGGVLGALARRADELYESLDANGQEATRQLFLRLVTLGEGSEDTRRRTLRSELEAITLEETGANTETDKQFIYNAYTELLTDVDAKPGMNCLSVSRRRPSTVLCRR